MRVHFRLLAQLRLLAMFSRIVAPLGIQNTKLHPACPLKGTEKRNLYDPFEWVGGI